MKILCIETSTSVCSISLVNEAQVIITKESQENYEHASKITILIREALLETAIQKKEVDAIALSMGPGSYTGLRIGTAVAKSLCFGLDIPLITLDSCHILANAHHTNADISLGLIDARRQDVYLSYKDIKTNTFSTTTFHTLKDELFDNINDKQISLAGDAANKTKAYLAKLNIKSSVYTTQSSSVYLHQMAVEKFIKNNFTNFKIFNPHYIKSANITK